MKNLTFLLVLPTLLVGCGAPSDAPVETEPAAWTKLDDHAKLEKLKNMGLAPQQKADAIKKLNLPEDEKQKAISEVMAGGGSTPPTAPPSNPSTTG